MSTSYRACALLHVRALHICIFIYIEQIIHFKSEAIFNVVNVVQPWRRLEWKTTRLNIQEREREKERERERERDTP